MRILVTGATGFTGGYLLEELAVASPSGHEIIAVSRNNSGKLPESVTFYKADLTSYRETLECVNASNPDAIIHLAGIRAGDLGDLLSVNVMGTKHLLDAVCESGIDPAVLVTSSSAVYGYAGELPITEDTPFRPVNDYGVSKAAQDALALSYHFRHDLKVSVARPFNLTGPAQDDSLVLGKLVRRWVESEKGGEKVELFNTGSMRDFIDIRDAVRAYRMIVESPSFPDLCAGKVFNIGSGRPNSIDDAIGLMREITGSNVEITATDSGFKEPVPSQQADIRAVRLLGWEPEIPFGKTLLDMYIHMVGGMK